MKWLPAAALFVVILSSAAPAYASGYPSVFTEHLRPKPLNFGGAPVGNGPAGCGTSPENPTILLAALALAGLYLGRKLNLSGRLQTAQATR